MKTNEKFLETIRESFSTYLQTGTSRSTAKLKSLHGNIANDLKEKFGSDFFVRSQGYGNGKEEKIYGRYYQKNVDIVVCNDDKPIAGYAVKFVMRNYSQNSNNYFENMLGETANIRANSIPYFQIFIIFDRVPYYEKNGTFKKYDVVSANNMDKYLALSKDDPSKFYHTPDKTLFVLVKLKEKSTGYPYKNDRDYADYYKSVINDKDLLTYADQTNDPFDDSVIYNDYEDFLERTYHIAIGRIKRRN